MLSAQGKCTMYPQMETNKALKSTLKYKVYLKCKVPPKYKGHPPMLVVYPQM